jgi:hypothetical protein
MAARKAQSNQAEANGRKNGTAARGRKTTAKATPRSKAPRNAEEATLIAWAATHENRHKRFKVWEDR